MIDRSFQSIVLILIIVLLSGCNVSLQSSQVTFVRNLLASEPEVVNRDWQVTWEGRVYPVYAINHEGGIFFANESGLIVTFDGTQVTSLFLDGERNKKIAQIHKTKLDNGGISLQFQDADDRTVGTHRCSPWRPVGPQNGTRGWNQQCADGSTLYTNEVRANEQNQVVALKHVLMPGRAPIVILQRQ